MKITKNIGMILLAVYLIGQVVEPVDLNGKSLLDYLLQHELRGNEEHEEHEQVDDHRNDALTVLRRVQAARVLDRTRRDRLALLACDLAGRLGQQPNGR